MRRSALALTGNNFYRRENEARGVELFCQSGDSIGVFDDMKLCPDGINIFGLPGWKIVSGCTGARHYDLVTEQNGFELKIPSVADGSYVTFQPNISFIGNFSFEFDIDIAYLGTTAQLWIILYHKSFSDAANYCEQKFFYSSGAFRLSTLFSVNGSYPAGTAGNSGAENGTKIRFRRLGTTIYMDYYKPSAWDAQSLDMLYASPVQIKFVVYNPDTSNYIAILMNNFVLNSGLTQILW